MIVATFFIEVGSTSATYFESVLDDLVDTRVDDDSFWSRGRNQLTGERRGSSVSRPILRYSLRGSCQENMRTGDQQRYETHDSTDH